MLNVTAFSFSNLCEIRLQNNQIKLSSLTGQSFGELKNMCEFYTIYLGGNPIWSPSSVDMQALCNSNENCVISY